MVRTSEDLDVPASLNRKSTFGHLLTAWYNGTVMKTMKAERGGETRVDIEETTINPMNQPLLLGSNEDRSEYCPVAVPYTEYGGKVCVRLLTENGELLLNEDELTDLRDLIDQIMPRE